MRQFDTAFRIDPSAIIAVPSVVKNRAALRTEQVGVAGAFAAVALFDAIIGHDSSMVKCRCLRFIRGPYRKSSCIDASISAPGQSDANGSLASALVGVAFNS